MTWFFMLTTSAHAMLPTGVHPILDDPEEELARISPTVQPDMKDAYFQEAQQFEQEEKYAEAALAYKKAGASGHSEALIRLGYLYGGKKLLQKEELPIEERRLIDAIAAFYIEKGANLAEGEAFSFTGHASQFHSSAVFGEEPETQEATISLADIHGDPLLEPSEKLFKIAQWYENQSKPDETIAQKRLRYAYAGRYYEAAALWRLYPKAFTALGHMYAFGKGIDISDEMMTSSAKIQSQEYYQGHMGQESDPEGQFMMGFLLEQDQTPESDDKAEYYYQLAASGGHAAAAFRLGIRAEQGQGKETNPSRAYIQAGEYYSQALGNETPPSFISELIGMPENLEGKVTLAKKLQKNLEVLEMPAYGLMDAMFCQHLRSNIGNVLMPYWVDFSLACYAQKHNLPYKQDPEKTAQHVKDIATLLNGTRPTQIIPDLTSYDQKLLNIQNAKNTFHNPGAALMRMQQIRQYLSQEDDDAKWLDVPPSNTKKHVELWLQGFQSIADGLNSLSKSFEGERFLETLIKRLEALPTAEHVLDPSSALWPQNFLEDLDKDLFQIKEETQIIFKSLEPYQRSLSQQIMTYKNLQEIKKHTGEPFSVELLQKLLLAQKLMMVSSHGENQSDKLVKHFQSARALKEYAFTHQLSEDQAKKELDQKAKEILPLLSPQLHDLSIVGYDVLIKLLLQPHTHIEFDSSREYRKKLLVAINHDNFDNLWMQDAKIRAYLSGDQNTATSVLTQLHQQAKDYIDEQERSLSPTQPSLNLPALTHEDPYIGLYGNIVPDTFTDLQLQAQELYASGVYGISEQEIYESLLDAEILNIRSIIDAANIPGINIKNFDSIIQVLEEASRSLSQKIDRKQNILFMLRKSTDWKNPDLSPDQIALTAHAIINGTLGRCADGQADYFHNWSLEYILNNLSGTTSSNTITHLKVTLSLFLQKYKNTFIEKNASLFKIGGSQNRLDANEDRTAMKTLLTQALRLPLSLMGSYNSVRYPSFAVRQLLEPEASLQIKAIIGRFLNGGEISYRDYRVEKNIATGELISLDIDDDGAPEPYTMTHTFEGLTLKTLGKAVREAFADSKDKRRPAALPGLLPPPCVDFVFPQKLIEDFLQHDALLASFYSTFIHSGYTKGNIFFDSEAAFAKGYHLQHILKDAAILRILEAGGYAKVPDSFYQTVSDTWKFE